MMISTKGRYALRLLVDIAQNQQESGYVPLRDVAKRQEISEKYLESITKHLVQAGFLLSSRGKGGGYRLAMSPEQCPVRGVLEGVEGPLVPVSCMAPGAKPCPKVSSCCTRSLWAGLGEAIANYLEAFTIADLMGKDSQGYDYII